MQLIADNLQILRPEIQAALNEEKAGPIVELVKTCIAAGAEGIDINSGPLGRKPGWAFWWKR